MEIMLKYNFCKQICTYNKFLCTSGDVASIRDGNSWLSIPVKRIAKRRSLCRNILREFGNRISKTEFILLKCWRFVPVCAIILLRSPIRGLVSECDPRYTMHEDITMHIMGVPPSLIIYGYRFMETSFQSEL